MFGTIPQERLDKGMTPRQRAGHYSSLIFRQKSRWVIRFSIKDHMICEYTGRELHQCKHIRKGTWPILFHSEAAAWDAIHLLNPFQNWATMAGRGKITSCSVERVTVTGNIKRKEQ